jgi:hypothetical protein
VRGARRQSRACAAPARGKAARPGAPDTPGARPRLPRGRKSQDASRSGKKHRGALLAATLGYVYADSGAMYRAVGLAAAGGIDPDDAAAVVKLVRRVVRRTRPDPRAPRRQDVTASSDEGPAYGRHGSRRIHVCGRASWPSSGPAAKGGVAGWT